MMGLDGSQTFFNLLRMKVFGNYPNCPSHLAPFLPGSGEQRGLCVFWRRSRQKTHKLLFFLPLGGRDCGRGIILLMLSLLVSFSLSGIGLASETQEPLIHLQYASFDPLRGEPAIPESGRL